ncbi:MAG: hypothetical protein NZ578_03330 [Candidatus Binatia bacterium]|nr:hypothetical protein [Candidatus Binatia bacterium]
MREVPPNSVKLAHPFEAEGLSGILPLIRSPGRVTSEQGVGGNHYVGEFLGDIPCLGFRTQDVLKCAAQQNPLHLEGNVVAIRVRLIGAYDRVLPRLETGG